MEERNYDAHELVCKQTYVTIHLSFERSEVLTGALLLENISMQVLFWILACGVIVWCAMLVQADEKSVPENVTHLFSNQSLSEIVNIAEQDKMVSWDCYSL